MRFENNKRSIFFILGITLFAISIVGTFKIPYFFFITPIFFLVASLFVWFSRRKTLAKIFWTVSPIGLLFLLLILSYKLNKMEAETYLIPNDFRGKFVIYFEESCGTDVEYENGKRIYRIPNDGVLITKFKREFGIVDDEFYLIDSHGNKTLLPKSDTRDFNFNGRLNKTDSEPPRYRLSVFSSNFTSVRGKGRSYSVASYQKLEDKFSGYKYYTEFEKLAEGKLQDCRENKH